MPAAIIDNRVAGSRVTVWDVYHYLEGGEWSLPEIAVVLHLSMEQVEAAVQYIEENKNYVLAVHREIEEREARGNPPEVLALMEGARGRMQKWLEEKRQARLQERNGDGTFSRR